MSSAKNITATIGAIILIKEQRNDTYSKFLIYKNANSYYNKETLINTFLPFFKMQNKRFALISDSYRKNSERNFTYEKYRKKN